MIKMYSPKCSKKNSEGARFCMHCGADLSGYKVEISPKIDVSPIINVDIPDSEETVVEIVREFNETLRTMGISNKVEPDKSLNLTKAQREILRAVEMKVNEVLEKFERPIGDPEAYIRLGNYELDLRNYERALYYHEKAIELDFDSGCAWRGRGFCYARPRATLGEYERSLKCFDKALECFDKAREIDSKVVVGTWAGRGIALLGLRRYEEAIRCFDRALEIDLKFDGGWAGRGGWAGGRGVALLMLGKWEEAIRCFDRVLEIAPKNAGTWAEKGAALHCLRRHEEAIRCFDRALAIDPNCEMARDGLKRAKKYSQNRW